ncbi:MAG TPA: hypothetical protein PKG95_10355 [Anaerolineaceae bacterium]|jgi:hypothetical protein|nr:hypothetical protein [Anaerolineaceae bacterium]
MPDPYVNKLLDTAHPCATKSTVEGRINCVLDARAPQRGLELCPYPSRAVLKHEIHELIITAEATAAPNATVNAIAYLGYFEVLQGGVLWVGDRVVINGQDVGTLAGYDLTHFPNHLNIIIKASEPVQTGLELGYVPGTPLSFIFPGRPVEGA